MFFLLTITIAGCGRRHENEVLVIEKTKSYHTDRCPRVNMANTRIMTAAEAEAMSCKPCKGCLPDKSR